MRILRTTGFAVAVIRPRVADWPARATTYRALAAPLLTAAALTAGCGGDGGDPKGGAAIFAASCANCHTLEAAGATGRVGPPLDEVESTAADIARQVREGGGGMPPFEGSLSSQEIDAVARYVEQAARP